MIAAWRFLRVRKRYWLTPIIITLLLCAALLALPDGPLFVLTN